mgnify:CR=1 FL=1
MLIPYPLADFQDIELGLILARAYTPGGIPIHTFNAFIPQASYVSLGASNKEETSTFIEACQNDGVAIFKRQSGGEAVFLSPNCAIYSHILVCDKLPKSSDYFNDNLNLVQRSLEALDVTAVERKGISDLCIAGKKILGCAIYRRQNFLMYQAVINVCEDPLLIQRYLKSPQREPDYRQQRSHADFVTSLRREGFNITPLQLVQSLTRQFSDKF